MRLEAAPTIPDWLSAQLPFARSTARIDEHGIHVMELGRGRPVLLLHGNPTWGYLYRKVARHLRGAPLRLVIPDLLGLGLSDKPWDPSAHSIEHHAHLIAQLIRGLDLDDLIFVGQDWGGPIGLRALEVAGIRVAGLVILNTVLQPPRPTSSPTWFHRFARWPLISNAAFRLAQFPQIALDIAQGDPHSITATTRASYLWPLRNPLTNSAPLALARMVPDSPHHPSIPGLQRVKLSAQTLTAHNIPRAIVWGEKDPVLGRALHHTQRLLGHPPTAITFAGHFLQEEVPGVIAAAIREVATNSEGRPGARA